MKLTSQSSAAPELTETEIGDLANVLDIQEKPISAPPGGVFFFGKKKIL